MNLDIQIINKKNLLKTGTVELFYDMYLKIRDIADRGVEHIHEEIERAKRSGERYSIGVERYFRDNGFFAEVLVPFLNKNMYLFTNQYKQLKIDKNSLNTFKFFTCELKKGTYYYRAGDFDHFLYSLERVLINFLFIKAKKRNPALRYSDHLVTQMRECFLSHVKFGKRNDSLQLKMINTISELYVYGSLTNVSCMKEDHYMVAEAVKVNCFDSDEFVVLPVHYCVECNKYFIGEESLRLYEEFYGRVILIRDYKEHKGAQWYELAKESKLHSTGYNADRKTWTEKERQHLLVRLIETNTMKFSEITRDLENSIHRFKNNPIFEYAIPKWERDLLFINEYALQHNV